MLATWGFLIAGLLFATFAFTFSNLGSKNTSSELRPFSYAYYAFSLALMLWGVTSALDNQELLVDSVIVGDGVLLLGTVFMVSLWLKGVRRSIVLALSILAATGVLYVRGTFYPPHPYMSSGILIFNTQTPVAVVLSLIIVLIWLPTNMKVAKQVARSVGEESLGSTFAMIYAATAISAVLFLLAQRVPTVVLSFSAIVICAALLIASNLFLTFLANNHGQKR